MTVQWIWGHAERIEGEGEKEKKLFVCSNSSSGREEIEIAFDYCVVAIGCQYGLALDIPKRAVGTSSCLWYPTLVASEPEHFEQLSPPLTTKSLSSLLGSFDERRITSRVAHLNQENTVLTEMDAEKKCVAIIGAGPVGVEFATELRHYFPNLRICIVEARDSCCSTLCQSAKDYIQQYLDRHGIKCFYGVHYDEMMAPNSEEDFWHRIKFPVPDRVFMSVGLRPHCNFLPSKQLSPGDRGGWITVNEYLQIVSSPSEGLIEVAYDGRVFAVGNCIDKVPGLGAQPKNVFPAEHMAVNAVKNILRLNRGASMRKYGWSFFCSVSATSLGPKDGVFVANNRRPGSGFIGLWGRLVVWQKEFIRWSKVNECRMGWLGWLVWSIVH
jgi:NADH dehydrogenase FAD-containing subunit